MWRGPGGFVGRRKLTIGPLIIRIGFWGLLYYTYNEEPPKPYDVVLAVGWHGVCGKRWKVGGHLAVRSGGGDGGGTVAARAFSQHFFTELYRFSRPKGSSNG